MNKHSQYMLIYDNISFRKGIKVGDKILPILQEVMDTSFNKEVIKSNCPVLVDFWAPWCGPCRMISPVIDEIANEYGDIIKVVKINTDKNPSTASEYGIRSIPTLMLFIEGKKIDVVIGAVPKSTLANILRKHLKKIDKR